MIEMEGLVYGVAAVAIFEGCLLLAMVAWILVREFYIRSLVREQMKFTSEMATVLEKVTMTIEQTSNMSKETKAELLGEMQKMEWRLTAAIERLGGHSVGHHHGTYQPPISFNNFGSEVGGAQVGNGNKQT